MQKVLVDTTVWIDYFRNKQSEKVDRLLELMEQDEAIYLSPTIVQEVLQGVRDDQLYSKIRDLLFGYIILVMDPLKSAIEAAQLYRTLRKKGITIRKSTDCLIAYYAITNDTVLLQNDRDFELIAKGSDLRLL
jgi:predicted nucleic acid-binding protein